MLKRSIKFKIISLLLITNFIFFNMAKVVVALEANDMQKSIDVEQSSNNRSVESLTSTIYLIPGIGEVALIITGGILIAGTIYYSGELYDLAMAYISYDNAKSAGTPTDKHEEVHGGSSLPKYGQPYSSRDHYDNNGLKQRRYYGPDGVADEDIDYRHGGVNHKFPHRHRWVNGERDPKPIDCIVKSVFAYEEGSWYYFNESGNLQIGWKQISGFWYLFNSKGIMQTGWINENEKFFYLNNDGQMQTGWQQINGNWYFLQPVATQTEKLGQMAIGWQKINEKMYYFESNGAMKVSSWVKSSATSKWYYVGSDGVMLTGWHQLDGRWFFFNNDIYRGDGVIGEMMVSWQIIDGKWYYFYTTTTATVSKGEMATGWLQIDGYWYYLYQTTTSTVTKGQMAVGWVQINSKWYYFYSNGRMAVNVTIDGYKLGSDGAMI